VKQHPPGFIDDARAQSQSQSQSQPQYQSQFQSLSPVPGQVNQPVSQSVRHAQGIAERRLWFRRPATATAAHEKSQLKSPMGRPKDQSLFCICLFMVMQWNSLLNYMFFQKKCS